MSQSADISRAMTKLSLALESRMFDVVKHQQAFLKRKFNEPKSGRFYNHGFGPHKASAPFEYPATESGALEASIRVDVRREGRNKIVGTVGAGAGPGRLPLYAVFLEFGTPKMAPRPATGGFGNKPGFLRNMLFDTHMQVGKMLAKK